MKIATLLVGVALLSATQLSEAAAADTGQDILAADTALDHGLASADEAAVRKGLDDRFLWTDRSGVPFTKAQVLAQQVKVGAADTDQNVQIRRYGRVALVFGDRHLAAAGVDVHFLHLYVRRGAGWRALEFRENTLLPPAASTPAPAAGPTGGASAALAPCDNPCRHVPFVAHSAAERAVIAAYQSLETASANADMETYAARLADELLIVNTQYRGTPTTKPAAYAVHEHQKETHTTGAPAPLQWAHISIFGDTAIMDSRQGSAKGQANAPVNLILRVWVDRDGRWQLAYSHQTLKLGSALK